MINTDIDPGIMLDKAFDKTVSSSSEKGNNPPCPENMEVGAMLDAMMEEQLDTEPPRSLPERVEEPPESQFSPFTIIGIGLLFISIFFFLRACGLL